MSPEAKATLTLVVLIVLGTVLIQSDRGMNLLTGLLISVLAVALLVGFWALLYEAFGGNCDQG